MNTQKTKSAGSRQRAPASKTPAVPKKRKQSADFIKPTDIVRVRGGVDRPMLVIIVLMLCFGSVMVFSASYAYAFNKYGDSFYFIKRQLVFGAIGIGAMFLAVFFDYRWIKKATLPIFGFTTGLLMLTPFIGVGKGIARRWIYIGPLRFQPSEIMKLAIVLFLAWFFARYQKQITDYTNFRRSSLYGVFMPVGVVIFVCGLIAIENHFSCMIIMFLIGMVVIFAGGARKIWFIMAGAGAAVASLFLILLSDYARERLDVWLHPDNYSTQDEVWQTIQGKIAIGSGGFFGVGLGNSRQKQLFVSEPQNDFIFSIICEELGFVGAVMVITLFLIFIWRGFIIALRAPDTFSSLIVVGIVGKVAIQAILNMAVVTAMIPNTGISLPFFSYGGTALAMQLGEMGILLSISRYSYVNK